MPGKYLREVKDGVLLSVVVAPNAKRSGVVGLLDDALKIALRAPAQEGKANAALIDFLANALELPKSAFELMRGHKSKKKLVHIRGVAFKSVSVKLGDVLYGIHSRPF